MQNETTQAKRDTPLNYVSERQLEAIRYNYGTTFYNFDSVSDNQSTSLFNPEQLYVESLS